ncbi:hypothetical protein Tco_0442331 [Tanacetum coccineum]
MEYMMKNMFGLRWNFRELKGIVKLRFFSLVKEQEKEYQTGWKIKTGNVLDSCNQRSTQQCMKSVSGFSKVFWEKDTTRSTYLVNRSTSSAIRFKKPIDMLGVFGWHASIKQGMLEPVKIKNMSYNESGEYKKIFIGSGVGTGSMQVFHGFEFEVEPLGDHTFEVEPQENVDQGASIEKTKAGLKDDMDAQSDVYVLSNSCKKCSDDNNGYYWEYTSAKGNVLGMEIITDHSGNTLRVSQSRFYKGKLVQTLLEGHFILSLEGSLSGDCDVEKNGKWSCIYTVGSETWWAHNPQVSGLKPSTDIVSRVASK